jgi:hypothetical protein
MGACSHKRAIAALIAGVILGGPAAGLADEGVTYRWVDEKGVVHYGDRVPPQYAEKERAVLNRQGVEVGRMDAQKSAEQLAADTQRNEQQLRQKQHDNFLLTTYTSVKDIESLRDVRVDQLKGQKAAAEQYVSTLHERLVALQTRAMLFKPYNDRKDARRMPDDLAEDIVRTLNEMHAQRNALAVKDEEEQKLRMEFDADIRRFRELRATARVSP